MFRICSCLLLVCVTSAFCFSQEAGNESDKPAAPPTDSQPAVKPNDSDRPEPTAPGQIVDAKPKPETKPNEEKKPDPPRSMAPIGFTNTPQLPGQPWRVHDLLRPRPLNVTPGTNSPAEPPSDAMVLFDGTDLSNWGHQDRNAPGEYVPARWNVKDGYMEAARGTGYLCSLDNFGSCQLHLEWASPLEPKGDGQARGNSGIKFWGAFEVQILDSYNNRTYADGQAGAVYGQYPPEVNATLPPGQWQAYDIIFEIPQFDSTGKLVKPAYLTVFHNGVLLHHHRELTGPTGRANSQYGNHPPGGPIMLQDHGNPVRYRNIWVRPL